MEYWEYDEEPRFLQMLINYWYPDIEEFNIYGTPLKIEVEYIYIIIRLSCQCEVVNIRDCGVDEGMPIDEYISTYFLPNTNKLGNQVPICAIQSLSLKVIILVFSRISGSTSLHLASQPLMFYVVECMRPNIYDWITSLLENMKHHLMECKLCKDKKFDFPTYFFFFERVSGLIPKVEVPLHGICDPYQTCWIEVMWWLGGDIIRYQFTNYFFH